MIYRNDIFGWNIYEIYVFVATPNEFLIKKGPNN